MVKGENFIFDAWLKTALCCAFRVITDESCSVPFSGGGH